MSPEQNKWPVPEDPGNNPPPDAGSALPGKSGNVLQKLPDLPEKLQDLDPKLAKFCLAIERFLTHDLGLSTDLKDSRVILGLSGGADSTALLLILYYLKPRLGFELLPAHLDHSLRPESRSESLWVRDLCAALKLPCFVNNIDVRDLAKTNSLGLEEAGRLARYNFFAALATESEKNKPLDAVTKSFIVTAHHLDDLAEDLLLRLVRGTGWPALAGMKALSPLPASLSGLSPDLNRNLKLLRPLLLTPKLELTSLLEQLNYPWLEDSSNATLDFKRNRMRNQVMPLLLHENPAFRDSIANLWRLGQLDEEHWEKRLKEINVTETITSEVVADKGKSSNLTLFIPLDTLLNHDQATRMRLYKSCLQKLGPGQVLASSLFRLDEALSGRKSGKIFAFPGYKKVAVKHEGLRFYQDKSSR